MDLSHHGGFDIAGSRYGFALGLKHATEADHALWELGHTTSLIVPGLPAIVLIVIWTREFQWR